MSPTPSEQKFQRRLLKFIVVAVFGLILSLAELFKGFEMFFPGPSESEKRGDNQDS